MNITKFSFYIATVILLCSLFFTSCSDDKMDSTITILASDTLFTIEENPDAGLEIGYIEAHAGNTPLRYELISVSCSEALVIDSLTGLLTVTTPSCFNYEQESQITATIKITAGNQNKSIDITINLEDIENEGSFTIGDKSISLDNSNFYLLFEQPFANVYRYRRYVVTDGIYDGSGIWEDLSSYTDATYFISFSLIVKIGTEFQVMDYPISSDYSGTVDNSATFVAYTNIEGFKNYYANIEGELFNIEDTSTGFDNNDKLDVFFSPSSTEVFTLNPYNSNYTREAPIFSYQGVVLEYGN